MTVANPDITAPIEVECITRASRLTRIVGVMLLALLASMPFWADSSALRQFTDFVCLLVMAQRWNLLGGYGGMVSIGQQVFIGIGGCALIVLGDFMRLNPFLCIPLAGQSGHRRQAHEVLGLGARRVRRAMVAGCRLHGYHRWARNHRGTFDRCIAVFRAVQGIQRLRRVVFDRARVASRRDDHQVPEGNLGVRGAAVGRAMFPCPAPSAILSQISSALSAPGGRHA